MSEKTIVLDNGSGSIYAGFAEEDNPVSVFSNCTGLRKKSGSGGHPDVDFTDFSDPQKYKSFVTDSKSGELKISYPIERGVIVDWEGMETVWNYAFTNALGANPEECNLLITEATMNPKPNREKMAQTLFEKFNFPAVSVSQSAILPLYSAGLTTGVVLDCGDSVVQTVPVWGGYPINEAINRSNYGGRDVSQLLGKLLEEKGHRSRPREVVKYIKENTGFVSDGISAKTTNNDNENQMSFELPDGEIIKVSEERHGCSELLFNPSLLIEESDKGGVHEMLYKSIMKTNMDIRKDLYGNIVLSGGSTLFPGFVERLSKEIAKLLPPKAKLTIRATPERRYATWAGGSVLASLSNFTRLLISKQEFEEVGPSIMHKFK